VVNEEMSAQIREKSGFIAALDQSGGSTPNALRQYGIQDSAYSNDAEMFKLIHEMRVRIVTAPCFNNDRIIGAILFEATMDGYVQGKSVPAFLWEDRGVVPFLKIDKGLETEANGVQLMKAIPNLDVLLDRAAKLGVFGTKMRSVISRDSKDGISAIVEQQFQLAAEIDKYGLLPILEPEVSIKSPSKAEAEKTLLAELMAGLDTLPATRHVMIKLTIPEVPDLYRPLMEHPRVARVVALSGGYSRKEACKRLAANHGLIASFSRALIDELKASMNDAEFDETLAKAVDEIYQASVVKV
jgi:fructose-bisphosphate aldolase class I